MPTVPRYPGRQIASSPVPGTRVANVAPAGAFGGDTRPLDAVDRRVEAFERNRRADNQIAFSDLDGELAAEEARRKLALRGVSGRAAKEAGAAALSDYQAFYEQLSERDMDDDVRAALERSYVKRREDLDVGFVQPYIQRETRAYDDQQTQAFLGNEDNAAAADFMNAPRARQAIERKRAAIMDFGRRNGLPAEEIVRLQIAEGSKTHRLVIERMLDTEQDLAAAAYYKANQADILDAGARGWIEKALKVGSRLGTAQRIVDGLMFEKAMETHSGKDQLEEGQPAPPKGTITLERRVTLKEGMDRIRELAESGKIDPETRQAAEVRLINALRIREEAEHDAQNAELERVWPRTAAELGKVTASAIAKLRPDQVEDLERRVRNLAEGLKVKTVEPEWLRLEMMTDEELLAQPSDMLTRLENKLSDEDWRKLADRIGKARAAAGGKGEKPDSGIDWKHRAFDAFRQTGRGGVTPTDEIDVVTRSKAKGYSDEKVKAFAQFLREAGELRLRFHDEKKRNPREGVEERESVLKPLVDRWTRPVKVASTPLWRQLLGNAYGLPNSLATPTVSEKPLHAITDADLEDVVVPADYLTEAYNLARDHSSRGLKLIPDGMTRDEFQRRYRTRVAAAYIAGLRGGSQEERLELLMKER